MNNRTEKIKNHWNAVSEEWNRFRTDTMINEIIENPDTVFRPQLQAMLKKFVGDFNHKHVLVPASGDNRAAFAFHLLGAKVTSSDLSEKQLQYSAKIAAEHHWDMEFICDDVIHLSSIKSDQYDFVYLSNGVMFWIDDLKAMYKNINRVLKPGGYYMMYDIHPFMTPLDTNDTTKVTIKKDYHVTGPFGKLSTYTWRLQDILNAMIASDLNLVHVEEMPAEYGTFWVDEDKADDLPKAELDKLYDSKTNPLYALPQAISLCAQKKMV